MHRSLRDALCTQTVLEVCYTFDRSVTMRVARPTFRASRQTKSLTFLMEWDILETLAEDSMRPFLANFHQKFTQK